MEDYGNNQYGIISGLDNDTLSAMKSAQKNWNDDFQNGNTTNVFTNVFINENGSYTYSYTYLHNNDKSTGENLTGVLTGIANTNQMLNDIISTKLVTYVTAYMTNVMMTYLQSSIVEMISFDGSSILTYATASMPKYLLKSGVIMNELLKTKEELSEDLLKDTQNQLVEKINGTISENVKNITDQINLQLDKINPAIGEIAYYSQMGPVWMQSKIDLAIKKIMEPGIKGITYVRDKVNTQKNTMIETIGNKMGEKLANRANEKLRIKTKEELDKANKEKQEAMTKVKTNIINAKLKIMAIIGG